MRSTRWAAPRRSSRSPTAPRRSRRSTSSPAPATPGCGRQSARSPGMVGIDSLAGPSELMVIAGHDTDPEWAALDLCAQAEHGADSPLVAVAVEEHVLDAVAAATEARRRRASERRRRAAGAGPGARRSSDAIDLANAFAPEHLELLEEDAALLAERVTHRRLRLRRPLRRDRLRRLRRRLQPRAADRRRRALLRAARARRLPPPDRHRGDSRRRRRRSWPRTSTRSPAPRASPSTASRR